MPNATALAGAIVLEGPPDTLFRDIQAVFRAVDGGWRTVNGYSGWTPSYYFPLIGAWRAEIDAMVTPFQEFGELTLLVSQEAPRLRGVIERQPGVTQVASDGSTVVYRLPKREASVRPRPDGKAPAAASAAIRVLVGTAVAGARQRRVHASGSARSGTTHAGS